MTELRLTEEMKQALEQAFAIGRPVAIAYVDEDGTPRLSYRGSTQAFSDTELAIWVRNPQGRILEATKKNPAVALIYGKFEPNERGFMIFRGRARIDDDESVRRRVFERAHEFERNQDQERKGIALIIELDSVEGFFGGAGLKMQR